MTDSAGIREIVKSILVENFELDPGLVVPTARLKEDLDLDSLDGVDLVVAIEKEFEVLVEDETVTRMLTVGEIQDYVVARLSSQAS